MTTYVNRQVSVQVSENSNGENLIFRRGDRVTKFEEIAALNEACFSKFSLTLPVTNLDLLDGESIVAGKILYLETDKEMTVKLVDTSDTGFKVKPVVTTDATRRGTLYVEGEFSHVYVSISGTGTANVLMGAVGA